MTRKRGGNRWVGVSFEDRLFAKREIGPMWLDGTRCWIWTGAATKTGYGLIYHNGRRKQVHTASWEHFNERSIPDGLEMDHLCRNPRCFNPLHVEPVTRQENIRRGSKAQQTHCKRGHEFTPENTAIDGGTRRCRACKAARRWAEVNGTTIEVALSTPRRKYGRHVVSAENV